MLFVCGATSNLRVLRQVLLLSKQIIERMMTQTGGCWKTIPVAHNLLFSPRADPKQKSIAPLFLAIDVKRL